MIFGGGGTIKCVLIFSTIFVWNISHLRRIEQDTIINIYFYNKKPMRCTISQIYFGKELYMFQTDLLSITKSLNTVYAATGICHGNYVDCLLVRSVLRLLMMDVDLSETRRVL